MRFIRAFPTSEGCCTQPCTDDPCECEATTSELVCGSTVALPFSTTFFGFTFVPPASGTFRIELSGVSGFSPYIYINPTDTNYPAGGTVLDYVTGAAFVSGFVGALAGFSGSPTCSAHLYCPPRMARMTWSAVAPTGPDGPITWVDNGLTEIDGTTDFGWDPSLSSYSIYYAGDLSASSGTWEIGTWNIFFEIFANYDSTSGLRGIIVRYEGTASQLFDDYSLAFASVRFTSGGPPPDLSGVSGGSASATIEALDPFP